MSDDPFLTAIRDTPEDETLRLVYADWLEDRADHRAAYLRAEVEHFRTDPTQRSGSPVWTLQEQIDPVWASRVGRAPFGILVPGLTFSGYRPTVTLADLKEIEDHWQVPLPPEYVAFLLCFNGGAPSKPYLYCYGDYEDGREHFYDPASFFSTANLHSNGRPFLLMSVVEAYNGHVSEGADATRLARLMPVGTVDVGDDCEALLALRMGGDDDPQITTVVYQERAVRGNQLLRGRQFRRSVNATL